MIGPIDETEFETFDEEALMDLDNDIVLEPMGIDEALPAPVPKPMMPAKPMIAKSNQETEVKL
jgi:hypothetical protein